MIRNTRQGFTLIELLVVIAIIAILAAILFPVLTRAREKARESACIVQMKEIAYAIQMYLDDWNGCYPDHASVQFPPEYVATGYAQYKLPYSNDMGGSWTKWFELRYRYKTSAGSYVPAGLARVLRAYVKGAGVFKCPSEVKNRTIEIVNGIPRPFLPYDVGASYFFKHMLCFYANNNSRPLKQTQAKYPKKATLLYEEGWHGFQRPSLWNPGYWSQQPSQPPIRVNAVFIDCHVGKIDVFYNSTSGHDANWYYYEDSSTSAADRRTWWDVSRGARDIF